MADYGMCDCRNVCFETKRLVGMQEKAVKQRIEENVYVMCILINNFIDDVFY